MSEPKYEFLLCDDVVLCHENNYAMLFSNKNVILKILSQDNTSRNLEPKSRLGPCLRMYKEPQKAFKMSIKARSPVEFEANIALHII